MLFNAYYTQNYGRIIGTIITSIHFRECIEIIIAKSVLEWLMSHNIFNRNTSLDKRLIIAVLLGLI